MSLTHTAVKEKPEHSDIQQTLPLSTQINWSQGRGLTATSNHTVPKIPHCGLTQVAGVLCLLLFVVKVDEVSKFLILPVSFEKKPSEKSD